MTALLMGYRHSDLTQEKACQRRSRGSQAPPSLPAGSCLLHITRDVYAPSSVPGLLQVFTLRMKESVKMQKALLPAWRGARLPGTSLLHQHMTAYHIDVLICGQFPAPHVWGEELWRRSSRTVLLPRLCLELCLIVSQGGMNLNRN